MDAPIIQLPDRFNAAVEFVDRHLQEGRGNRIALRHEGRTFTYGQVAEWVNRAGNALQGLGVEMENRVLLLLYDSPEFAASFFGAMKIGAVPVPVNTLLRAPDYEFLLNDSRAKVLIAHRPLWGEVAKVRDRLRYLRHVVIVGEPAPGQPAFEPWISGGLLDLLDKRYTLTFDAEKLRGGPGMRAPIVDQVVDFYYALFERVFSEPFRSRIAERLKRDAVIRQIQDSAGAASQSLTRFFLNEQLTEEQVAGVLEAFAPLRDKLTLDDIANPNVIPEAVVDRLLTDLPCPAVVRQAGHDAVYRVSLHSVVQVLMFVGPVMAEWQKLNFSSTFELPRRIVNRLNQISQQIDALGASGPTAADERYEISYRDYLLQRFHRVEAGTVRMTTNLDVDLRELFVMPRVLPRPLRKRTEVGQQTDTTALMDLAAAREFFGGRGGRGRRTEPTENKDKGILALDQVKRYSRSVIVGAPGSGKSTFLEWLQLKLAAVEEELVMAGQQAIPLLLRVRQLDPHRLPRGATLIEKATASQDRAALMPPGWIDRQMKQGRVLFMLDGLDETEPDLRDMRQQYPRCRYLVSSRPVGYPPGTLRSLGFVECDLLDFGEPQINEYTRHWCTAVRLARNEPEEEARREGIVDGKRIVDGFENHPYIRHLARNPLMLSAICLVNYFESGQLPKDRAVLYKFCVEGLLHHWDQRRGIYSEFTLDEKLRTCREVALAMQADDRAECEADKVEKIFAGVLGNDARAKKLLEHIRYRTGLLLERRQGVFAFAHLTFQEYLAARAVHEGNRFGVNVERLVQLHGDGRWQEVIALYCGLAPSPAVRDMIERLIAQPDTLSLSTVLAEAYLSAGPELSQDREFRRNVLERIALAPGDGNLQRFPADEVAPTANRFVGRIGSKLGLSESFRWLQGRRLQGNMKQLDAIPLAERLRGWRRMNPFQVAELIYLLHAYVADSLLAEMALDSHMYAAAGPEFLERSHYKSQAEIALIGLSHRNDTPRESPGVDAAFLQILRTLSDSKDITLSPDVPFALESLFSRRNKMPPPQDVATWPEFTSLARRLAERLAKVIWNEPARYSAITALNNWADSLERVIAGRAGQETMPKSLSKSRTATRSLTKNRRKRR